MSAALAVDKGRKNKMYFKKATTTILSAAMAFSMASTISMGYTADAAALKKAAPEKIVIEKDIAGNPLFTEDDKGNLFYGADPSVLVDGDTVYAYMGHDESSDSEVNRKIYNLKEYCCFSTKDMKTWKWEGPSFQASTENVSWVRDSSSSWASQVTKYKDKYYLYFCSWDKTSAGKQSIGVAVSDSPTGPFTDIGEPLVKGTLTMPQSSNWDDIDPTIWFETDESGEEHRYLAWGNSRYYVCELNEDMISVKDINGDGKITCGNSADTADIINRSPIGYTEAPWIYRRTDAEGKYTGPYYLFYASGWHEKMAYSTTDDLMRGTWTYGSILMTPTATSNTNHMAVFDFQGKTYFMYHNGSQPGGNGYRRIPCITELHFNEDGTIQEMEETAKGLTGSTSAIYTNSGALLEHEYFQNSSAEGNYPYVNQQIGVGIGKNDTDREWLLMKGKISTDDSCISIQSENKPGLYITAQSASKVTLAQDTDATEQTAEKQTFITLQGLSGKDGISFESVAYPNHYLTMVNGQLKLSDGTDAEAATFYRNIDEEDTSLRSISATIKDNQTLEGNTDALEKLAKNISLTLAYGNGTVKTTEGFTTNFSSVDINKTGVQSMTVEYTEGTVKKTTSVPVQIIAKPTSPKKLTVTATAKKKKVSVKYSWQKAAGKKYELSWGTKKSQHKILGTVDIAKNTKIYSRPAKTFKKGKSYYFHIRTYTTVNSEKVYSAYQTVHTKVK